MERRHLVEILFHEALALEPSARTTFLNKACSGETDLFEEVVSLISAHEQSWTFLDAPVNYTLDQETDDVSQTLVGTSIGRYQVMRLIKRSGMGEVYLARDTHLPRDVALKLLPLMFTGDESRLRRFILEAEAASSLNHPNILTIHEIGHIHDVHYIATEFVDGQTLRERLADGPLELSEALGIAVAVTNALVASHAAGIVHRDIKPENIMIRRDGYVKVLDFGLAKLTERPDVRVDGSSSSISSMNTDPGTFMGTIGYLSPEQATSGDVDTRSDLFSLGVVLYEMITGQNPFHRGGFAALIDPNSTTEPVPLAALVSSTPLALQRIVTRALSRSKLNRYQRAEDLLSDLKAVQVQLQQQAMPHKLTPRERWLRLSIGVVAIIALGFAGVDILRMLNRSRSPNGDLSARLAFSEVYSWKSERGEGSVNARFSHDGQLIAFTMMRNQQASIWVKQALKEAEPRQLTDGTTSNSWPIWSPHNQQVAFVSTRDGQTGIWSVSAHGGTETLLSPIEDSTVRTRSWSKSGRTIYYELNRNLYSLDVPTRTITQLTHLELSSYRGHFSVAPNEDRICYVEINNGQADIWVASLHGESPFKVTDDAVEDRWPTWHPDGKRIVFTSKRGDTFQICVTSIDATKPIQVTNGSENHMVSDISSDGSRLLDSISRDDAVIFAVDMNSGLESEIVSGIGLKLWPIASPDGGTILFHSANATGTVTSSTILGKRTTNEGPIAPIASNGFGARWSPDGSRVAFLRFESGKFEIFVVNASGEGEKRLTTGGVEFGAFTQLPTTKFGRTFCWSEQGDKIIYSSIKSGVSNIWAVSVDGSADTLVSTNTDPTLFLYEPTCGPGGRIAFAAESRRNANSIWSLLVRDDNKTELVFQSKSLLRPLGWSVARRELLAGSASNDFQTEPTAVNVITCSIDGYCRSIALLTSTYFWSVEPRPDGRTIAFISNRSGSDNVWHDDLSGAEAERLTSNNDPKVFFPSLNWSTDGKNIYYGKQTSLGVINMIDNFE